MASCCISSSRTPNFRDSIPLWHDRRSGTVLTGTRSAFGGVPAAAVSGKQFPQAGAGPELKHRGARHLGGFDGAVVAGPGRAGVSRAHQYIAMNSVQFGCRPHFAVFALEGKPA